MPPDAPRPLLTQREAYALRYHEDHGGALLSESLADRMYVLYRRGMSCEDIRTTFKCYSLGQVVDARLRYRWDVRREEDDRQHEKGIAGTARRAQLDAVQYVTELMSATQAVNQAKIRTFLATMNPADLGDLALTPKGYQEAANLLLKLTGQDREARPGRDEAARPGVVSVQAAVAQAVKPMDPAEAAKALAAVEAEQAPREGS